MRTLRIAKPPIMDYNGTEALNTICTNLTFAGQNIKSIVMTSCVPSEGKSTLCMEIAMTLAKRGMNCVILDADLRKSMMIRRREITTTDGEKINGLVHYLAGYVSLDDICYQTNIAGVDVIPAGRDVTNPLALINTPDFGTMMETLTKRYDMVIVDAPPIGLVIDAAEIAKHCDGTVFVIEYGKRHRHEVRDAVQQMKQSGCPILGCIIDKVTVKTLSEKQYYKSHYYYGHYGYYNKSESDSAKGNKK